MVKSLRQATNEDTPLGVVEDGPSEVFLEFGWCVGVLM